jgi:indolepyruvate decarboxylase
LRQAYTATTSGSFQDTDADRFGVASDLMALSEKMQVPVAVINTAKGVIDETFPHYLGIYNGKASEPHVRATRSRAATACSPSATGRLR